MSLPEPNIGEYKGQPRKCKLRSSHREKGLKTGGACEFDRFHGLGPENRSVAFFAVKNGVFLGVFWAGHAVLYRAP